MSKFKIGDRVKLVNLLYPDSDYRSFNRSVPNKIGNVGRVVRIDTDDMPYHVKWDNGSDAYYHNGNLVLKDHEDTERKCIDE